jgi:hypothetical protein
MRLAITFAWDYVWQIVADSAVCCLFDTVRVKMKRFGFKVRMTVEWDL